MSISKNNEVNRYVNKKELMNRIGKEGEEEVGFRLSKIFGSRNVSYGVDGFTTGVDGYPDVSFLFRDNLFFVEVKSIIPFYKKNRNDNIIYRKNSVKLNISSWNNLKERAKGKIATIIMIIELRLLGENDYFVIDYDTIEALWLEKDNVEWLHIPLHFILLKCKKLDWVSSEFIPNPIDTSQSSL